MLQSSTGIPSCISGTSQVRCMERQSFWNQIQFEPITRFLWSPRTFPKWQLSHRSGYSNLCECHLAYETRPRHFSVSWTRYYVAWHSPIYLHRWLLTTSEDSKEHNIHIRMVSERLQYHGILINPSKYELGIPQLQFLEHQIDSHGIRPLPDKVQAVKEFSQPTTTCMLQKFLGSVNFYHTSSLMQHTFCSRIISC